MLRSDLCDVYIVVKGTIHLLSATENKNDKQEKDVTFKNNALFRSCILKINKTSIENAKEFYTVRV